MINFISVLAVSAALAALMNGIEDFINAAPPKLANDKPLLPKYIVKELHYYD